MPSPEHLVDEVMLAFRERLVGTLADMSAARDAALFVDSERRVGALTREMAAELTRHVLQEISDDKERRKEALARVRSKAKRRGIEVRTERSRRTPIRTLGGQVVSVHGAS